VDEGFGYVQVFTGDTLPEGVRRRSAAVEPMTCPPDAFRSGKDVIRLAPGRTTSARWGIRAG
jgi:aldose 1-epimerase